MHWEGLFLFHQNLLLVKHIPVFIIFLFLRSEKECYLFSEALWSRILVKLKTLTSCVMALSLAVSWSWLTHSLSYKEFSALFSQHKIWQRHLLGELMLSPSDFKVALCVSLRFRRHINAIGERLMLLDYINCISNTLPCMCSFPQGIGFIHWEFPVSNMISEWSHSDNTMHEIAPWDCWDHLDVFNAAKNQFDIFRFENFIRIT